MTTNPYAAPSAPLEGDQTAGSQLTPEALAQIKSRITRNNLLSFALGLPGLGLQVAGNSLGGAAGGLTTLAGTALLIGGLVFYARLRGRSPYYSLLGLLSCVGMFVLYFIPKKCLNCGTSASYRKTQCVACGAPLGG